MKSSDILLSLQGEDLEVWKVGDEVCVQYRKAGVSEPGVIIYTFGRGCNFEEACDDYLNKIRGKKLIFDAASDARREITILG